MDQPWKPVLNRLYMVLATQAAWHVEGPLCRAVELRTRCRGQEILPEEPHTAHAPVFPQRSAYRRSYHHIVQRARSVKRLVMGWPRRSRVAGGESGYHGPCHVYCNKATLLHGHHGRGTGQRSLRNLRLAHLHCARGGRRPVRVRVPLIALI